MRVLLRGLRSKAIVVDACCRKSASGSTTQFANLMIKSVSLPIVVSISGAARPGRDLISGGIFTWDRGRCGAELPGSCARSRASGPLSVAVGTVICLPPKPGSEKPNES
jgi:hypothetical protein